MDFDRLIKVVQLVGAALAVPAGAAGVYSAYRSYFSTDVACQNLRAAIVGTMEKNVGPAAKLALLRKDVAGFDKTCGGLDPDARAIFQAAVQQLEAQASRPRGPSMQVASAGEDSAAVPAGPPGSARPPFPALANLVAPPPSERRGWVALGRRDAARFAETNFDGYVISAKSLPPPGTILTARWPVPIWADPQEGLRPDLSAARALLRAGMCVRVISAKANSDRLWGEVAVTRCP
jgi:hypothetical protein